MDLDNEVVLVNGPSSSGKSLWAERLIESCNQVAYIATSFNDPNDSTFQERINKHRERRPVNWKLIEASSDLPNDIRKIDNSYVLIIESLGGFVAQTLHLSSKEWSDLQQDLINTITNHKNKVIIVIEEASWGVVPTTSSGLMFRDRLGLTSQELEPISKQFWLVISGRAIDMKTYGVAVK